MTHIRKAWFCLQGFIFLLRFPKSCWEAVSFEAIQLDQRENTAGKLFRKETGEDDPFLDEVILRPGNRLNIFKVGKIDLLGHACTGDPTISPLLP